MELGASLLVAALFAIVVGALISGFVIWIVGKLGLGLEVSGFGAAFVAAIVIAIISTIVDVLLAAAGVRIGGGLAGGIVHLVIAALVLMFSGSIVPGLRVNGFLGAMVAAIAIGVVAWLIALVAVAIGISI